MILEKYLNWLDENDDLEESIFPIDSPQLSKKPLVIPEKIEEPIAEKVRQQALDLTKTADLVLFMVDGSVGLTPQEFEIARYLHKVGCQVILVANKSDIKRFAEHELELKQLGFDKIMSVSAAHNKGVDELLDEVVYLLPKKEFRD